MDKEKKLKAAMQIVHTWADFACDNGLEFLTREHMVRIRDAAKDVIAYLTPRQLQEKEIRGTLYNPVWFETRDEELQCWAFFICKDSQGLYVFRFDGDVIRFDGRGYGGEWQVWTREPTDAQREVMWDD